MTSAVDISKPFVAVDGWEYASIGDFMLGERIGYLFSQHNALREASNLLKNWKAFPSYHVTEHGHRDPEEYL